MLGQVLLFITVIAVTAGVTFAFTQWRTARAARRVRQLIEDIDEVGRVSGKLPWRGPASIRQIARSVDALALRLERKLRTLTQQRNELEALLASMNEGVLAVDLDERLIRVNPAAGQMLRINRTTALGRELHAVVRNAALLKLIDRAMRGDDGPMVADILVQPDVATADTNQQDTALEARAATLHGASGQRLGVLVVLHDVTRLRRLEVVRSEFVANVSHEMKTPITAIKGFVETLLEDDQPTAEDGKRFLQIVLRQADRLQAIFEDLLTLARIEGNDEKQSIVLDWSRVRGVVDAAVESCRLKAEGKQIDLITSCPEELYSRINAPLLEQAMVNLVDNAIKYSGEGGTVHVTVDHDDQTLILSVADRGTGIPAQHVPRLFERFYRVDRARSREMGGTGLGLAIVKHVAQAHDGRVDVESRIGEGSTFRLVIPQPTEQGSRRAVSV